MGRAVGEERSAAHEYGDRVVVRWTAGGMVEQEKRWKAEEELVPGAGHHADWLGHECASAELGAEYPCA